jgi:hypothetical protein
MRILLSALFLLVLANASSADLISGALSGTLGPGIFHVVDTIWVLESDSLTLLPGTIFLFDGPYPFQILGTFLAEGTESDSIFFMTYFNSAQDRWRGLRFVGSASSGGRLAFCTIRRGYATGGPPNWDGGGVCCAHYSSPSFTECTILSNSADGFGGGVNCYDHSSPTFTNCRMKDNSAVGFGGGVCCMFYCSPTFTGCTMSHNSAQFGGGACCYRSSPNLVNCDVSDNSASQDGGGIYCYLSSSSFVNCVINRNSAGPYTGYGGGICNDYSSPSLFNCTLSGNSAYYGGGVFCRLSAVHLNSTVVAFSSRHGVYFSGDSGSQIEYCDIFGNSGGNLAGEIPLELAQIVTINANGDPCDRFYNIFLDPMFVDASEGDFHLQLGSPCIDAGDPSLPLDPDSTIADIGAFYFDQSSADRWAMFLPESHVLHPSWPNPFNSTTTIRYEVGATAQVELVIFNMLGQRVTELAKGRHSAGSYIVTWDAGNLPSGVYLCQMEAGSFRQTRRLVLVK